MPEKVSKSKLNYREADFPTGECEYCRYFLNEKCKVVEGDIDEEFVCDAWQGKENVKRYKIPSDKIEAFGKGMKKLQPYQHKVIDMIETPVGWLMIIEDTMKPKPHRFSLTAQFSIDHTSREHHWTQEEVDNIISAGLVTSKEKGLPLKKEGRKTSTGYIV